MRFKLRSESGIALVMVLWVLVMLVILVMGLVASTRSDLRAVANFKDDRQAYFLAYAGIQMGIREIMDDYDYNYYSKENQLLFARSGDGETPAEFSSRTGIKLGGGLIDYTMKDENGKINLNLIAPNRDSLIKFFTTILPGGADDMEEIADSIVDWWDKDDLHHAKGAESRYYKSLNPSYNAKNGEFDTLSELKRVKGVTNEIYSAVAPYLTVYPVSGINLNTADEKVMLALGKAPEDVRNIINEREAKGYYNEEGKSNVFVIISSGRFQGGVLSHGIRAVVKKGGDRKVIILNWEDDYYDYESDIAIDGEEEKKR